MNFDVFKKSIDDMVKKNNDIPLYVCDDGIKLVTNSISANIDVRDTITYIIKK